MKERPLNTAEVAEFLQVNEWTVRVYITSGLLKAHKIGNGTGKRGSRRRWRIWKHDLIDFINKSPNTGVDDE